MGEGSGAGAVTAYLGLGASLGDRVAGLQRALERLHSPASGLRVVAVSSLYESPHMGLKPGDETRFPRHLNAVAEVVTTLSPEALLTCVQAVEDAGGRQRGLRWGPRTIDIDILVYGAHQIETDQLTVPHPGIAQRAFVVLPLRELAPALSISIPNGMSIAALAAMDSIRNQQIELFDATLRLPE